MEQNEQKLADSEIWKAISFKRSVDSYCHKVSILDNSTKYWITVDKVFYTQCQQKLLKAAMTQLRLVKDCV